MWVNFTAVELWFSQAFPYIFNREVASKDTKQQDFLFLVRQWHRACKFDEKGRFLTSNGNGNNQTAADEQKPRLQACAASSLTHRKSR